MHRRLYVLHLAGALFVPGGPTTTDEAAGVSVGNLVDELDAAYGARAAPRAAASSARSGALVEVEEAGAVDPVTVKVTVHVGPEAGAATTAATSKAATSNVAESNVATSKTTQAAPRPASRSEALVGEKDPSDVEAAQAKVQASPAQATPLAPLTEDEKAAWETAMKSWAAGLQPESSQPGALIVSSASFFTSDPAGVCVPLCSLVMGLASKGWGRKLAIVADGPAAAVVQALRDKRVSAEGVTAYAGEDELDPAKLYVFGKEEGMNKSPKEIVELAAEKLGFALDSCLVMHHDEGVIKALGSTVAAAVSSFRATECKP